MKKTSRRFLPLATVVLGCTLLILMATLVAAAGGESFAVEFGGASYNAGVDQTTITYTVSADGTQGDGWALSHWDVEMCLDYYVVGSALGTGYAPQSRVDEGINYTEIETGTWTEGGVTVTGIKWGNPFDADGNDEPLGDDGLAETDVFTYVLRGRWTASLTDVNYILKFGQGETVTSTVTGPNCDQGPTTVALSTFTARSSSGSVSPMWLGSLVGVAVLAGSIAWSRRRSR